MPSTLTRRTSPRQRCEPTAPTTRSGVRTGAKRRFIATKWRSASLLCDLIPDSILKDPLPSCLSSQNPNQKTPEISGRTNFRSICLPATFTQWREGVRVSTRELPEENNALLKAKPVNMGANGIMRFRPAGTRQHLCDMLPPLGRDRFRAVSEKIGQCAQVANKARVRFCILPSCFRFSSVVVRLD